MKEQNNKKTQISWDETSEPFDLIFRLVLIPNAVNADRKTDDYIALRYWHFYISGEEKRKCFPKISPELQFFKN